jgi:hypothetical protein
MRVLAALAICLAIAVNWKLLRADHQSALRRVEDLVGAGTRAPSANFNDYPTADRSPEAGMLDSSNPVPNSDTSTLTRRVPNLSLSPERFNAALAAGLIDPSRIRLLDPIIPSLSSPAERSKLSGLRTSAEHPVEGTTSVSPLVTVEVESPPLAAAAKPAKPTNAVSKVARSMDGTFPTVPMRPAEAEPNGGLYAPPESETFGKDPKPAKKPISVRFVVKSGTGGPESSLVQKSMGRNDPTPNGTKVEKSTGRRTDDRDSQSQDLAQNLQRFASDFVRADQEGIGEQERFFAESVHFYREGDLSLAGVAAATRRYHRERQTRRSEAAGPAIATGPVNGGFFVIEQPVRWTRSQGSKVLRGRSVLRLRVVPINRGGWKITSIDEVNR